MESVWTSVEDAIAQNMTVTTEQTNTIVVGKVVIHSFIHSFYFYSTSSSLLLLRGAPDTAWILCRSFTPKCYRQLRVKDLPTTLLAKGDEYTTCPLLDKVVQRRLRCFGHVCRKNDS